MVGSGVNAHYDGVAKLLHWLIAFLILLIIPAGLVMTRFDSGPLQDRLLTLHESIGISILVLTVLRFLWRILHGAPPPSPSLNSFQIFASGTVHWLLYALLIVMPVSGYLFVVAGGFPLTWFDIFEVPKFVAKNEGLSKLGEKVHLVLQYAVYAAVGLHVAAALHHRFVKRDDVLSRMLPF